MNNFASLLSVFLGVDYDAAPGLLSRFYLGKLLFELNGIRYEPASISLNQHQLQHVDLFIGHPGLVEFFKLLCHVIDDLLNRNVDIVLYDSLVDVSNNALNDSELLKKLAACIQNLLRKNVFLPVDPQIGEPLLRRI